MCQAGLVCCSARDLGAGAIGVGDVFVHRARDHVEIQPLGALRRVEHELRQRFRRGIAQPVLHRQAVALRLADLLRVLVEEQLVGQRFRRRAAEHAADPAGQLYGIDQVLAGHLVIDAERVPAHRPVGLPLQLAGAALHRRFVAFAGVGVAPDHRAGLGIPAFHRHLHDDAGLRMDRQDRRVGRAAIGAERRQDHLGDFFITFQDADQRRVEPAGGVVVGGGGELVLEAEGIQEGAQPGVVVGAEGVVGAERIRDAGQRLAEILCQHLLVRHVVRDLAQPVHVVAERQQAGRQAGQHGEGVAHPGGAGDLAERADMRQAGRAVAGLEQRVTLAGGFQAVCDLGGFLEGPGLGDREGVVTKCCGHGGEARGAGGGGSMTGGKSSRHHDLNLVETKPAEETRPIRP